MGKGAIFPRCGVAVFAAGRLTMYKTECRFQSNTQRRSHSNYCGLSGTAVPCTSVVGVAVCLV